MFEAAVAAAQPAQCLAAHLPAPPRGRTIVIGAGKAAAAMAHALEDGWKGDLCGTVVTRYGYSVPCRRIEVLEAAHPVPDEAGVRAAARIRARLNGLGPDDLVIALVSGGGSALLVEPPPGVTLADKRAMNAALLRSGATIREMNCVRRHVSGIKGGRLAVACHPARLCTLLISDIPGDDPTDIASGPTVADAGTRADALAILARHAIDVPDPVRAWLHGNDAESVKPGDPRLARTEFHIIATPQMALEAAARVARGAGLAVHILGDALEGEARDLGIALAGITRQVVRHTQPFAPPCVLLSGGETTVTVRANGRGGRNVEFLLALGIALDGLPGVHAIACDTDGVDGTEEIAGGILAPDSLERAWSLGMEPRRYLDVNDAHAFFSRLDDSVITGPTWTNVNDFRAVLIGSARR
ncbi:MAG: glycerate kinase [Betaproteobacteria bacterium]|nr:glycerate kinase [Betaproteobacteria bacterium]